MLATETSSARRVDGLDAIDTGQMASAYRQNDIGRDAKGQRTKSRCINNVVGAAQGR